MYWCKNVQSGEITLSNFVFSNLRSYNILYIVHIPILLLIVHVTLFEQ